MIIFFLFQAVNIYFYMLFVFRYVVDSGFVKQLSFNARTGLDSLNVVLISRYVYEILEDE